MATDHLSKAAGVEDLIDRLKTDGVTQGRLEAEAIVADAKRQAMAILDQARHEADQVLEEAKKEAERVRQTSQQALQLAARDSMLKLRESFQLQFENRLQKLVTAELAAPGTLKQLILEVAGKASPSRDGAAIELLLPADSQTADPLLTYVSGLTGEMLREGVTFGVGEDVAAGIRVRLVDRDVEIDLSDQALSDFLARFLVPRFREIMNFKS